MLTGLAYTWISRSARIRWNCVIPCTLISALTLKVTGTQALHSPVFSESFVPWISMSAAPEPSVHFTLNGTLMSFEVASCSSRSFCFSDSAPAFCFALSSRSSCRRIGLSGPFSIVCATPPSNSRRFRNPPNSTLPSSNDERSLAQ